MEKSNNHKGLKPNGKVSTIKDFFTQKHINKVKKGPFGFFITRPRVVILLIIAIVIMGLFSLAALPKESDPEVKIPIAVVSTFYPGASPSDVEDLITDKIEKKLEELDNVDMITSTSSTSISSVVVEFEAEADLDDSIRELKDKVAEVSGLPDEAEDPVVTQIRVNDYAVITFSLAGNLTDTQMKQLSEMVQDELEAINGVSKVPLMGTRNREFSVIVNQANLSRLNLSLGQVVGAIRASNLDMPLGDISVNDVNYNLRTIAKLTSIDDLKKVVISSYQGQSILLSDVAEVKEQFTEQTSISRISLAGQPAAPSVSLHVYVKTGGNILEAVDTAKAKMEKLQAEKIIPESVTVDLSSDYSVFIRDDINTLGFSGVQAAILIFLVILIALNVREALISLLAIPLTFFITFIFLSYLGYTINSLVLFTMVLSLGLLVDTFIIILEGIFDNMRKGHTSLEAGLLSVAHYRKPLTSGTLTTIAAFVPMLLVSGIMGEYLKVLPITISIILGSSLFVSLLLVPSIGASFLKRRVAGQEKKESLLEKWLTARLRKRYRQRIVTFLNNRKSKIKFSIALAVLFVASIGLFVSGIIKIELFPPMDIDFAFLNLKMPVGTDLKETDRVIKQVEEVLYAHPEVKSFVTTVGQSSGLFFMEASSSKEHLANININFTDPDDREIKSYEMVEDLRKDLAFINEGEITLEELTAGPPTGAPIEVRVSGHDLIALDQLANQIKEILKGIEGTANVSSSQEISPADLSFTLNKEALAKAGLTVGEVSSFLRTAVFGTVATEISKAGEDIDVVVRLAKDKISSVEEIKNLSIINTRGQAVKLASLADFSLEPALAAVRHRDFERTMTIRADVKTGFNTTEITNQVEEIIMSKGIPAGYSVDFGGEVEEIEQSFTELWNATAVAILLILIILVLQFNSFTRPIVILLTLPLMFIGVTIGVLIFGLGFSIPVFLGIVSLTGIVVNDAIVLLDKANRNIKEKKMLAREAVADAGDARLQPIMLTSITTIIGVVPLIFANEMWIGLSVSIIFGLAFATILQLFVVPMLFLQFEGKKILKEHQTQQAETDKLV